MRRLAVSLAALTLVAAACTAQEPAAPPRDQLAIIDANGNISVIDRDGVEIAAVTTDAAPDSVYFQPTWSPDGDRLAFARAGTDGAAVVIHDVDGGTSERITTALPAFYFSWSRDADRLAYLANAAGGAGIELTVVDATTAPVRTDIGQPYYFSWGDNGSMVTHIGVDGLTVVDAQGMSRDWPLGIPGAFRAPHWIDGGILYLERSAAAQRLVIAPQDGEPTPVAEATGGATFIASPTGERVAIQAVDPSQDGQFAVAGRMVMAQATPILPANRLVVLDLETGEWSRVADQPVVAFSWSPTGERLLVLTVSDRASVTLEWQVWSDEGLSGPVTFVPGPRLLQDVLPFFDQYAQSLSFWSPDGTAFAFPGIIDGDPGIWVVALSDDMAAEKVADGSWVAWSPR